MLRISFLLLLFLQQGPFRVVGEIEVDKNLPRWGRARLESVDGKWLNDAYISPDGKFQFKKVKAGQYYLTVRMMGFEEVRRTVEVAPSLADGKRRVDVKLDLPEAARQIERPTVSVTQLSVSPNAMREYQKALKSWNDRRKAQKHLEKAIELTPMFEEALNDLGTLFHRDREYDKSIALFERALKVNPQSFAARVNLAGSLISVRDFERAAEENRKALDLRPEDSLANAQMGIALFNLTRDEEALPYLQKVKQIDPFSPTLPELFLAEIYLRDEQLDLAAVELQDFLKHHPSHPEAARVQARLSRFKSR